MSSISGASKFFFGWYGFFWLKKQNVTELGSKLFSSYQMTSTSMTPVLHQSFRSLAKKTSLKSGVHQLRLVVYPIIYRVLYIPGGAGFLPSTVVGCWVSIRCFQQKISSCCIPFWQTLGRYVAPHDQSCHISHVVRSS